MSSRPAARATASISCACESTAGAPNRLPESARIRSGSATSRSVANELAAARWARRRAACGSAASASAGAIRSPTASAIRSSRTSAASGSAASARAGAITGNTCDSTLPIRVAGSTSRCSDSYARERLREPEPGEELLGRLAVVAGRGLDRARERLEERPVEQALVDPADEVRRAVVLGLQRVGAGEPERARQGGARVPVGREVVGLEVAHHLEPVLQPAQEPVGVGERLGVLVRHVALVRERGERVERVRIAQALVAPAVDDLEELHGELDVADAAAAALDLGELLAAAPDVLLEPDLRAADVVDRGLVEVLRVDELGDAVDERRAEARSPAAARALIIAWRSQVAASRS